VNASKAATTFRRGNVIPNTPTDKHEYDNMKKIILLLLLIDFTSRQAKGQLTTLLNFTGATNGSYPYGSLLSDGTFLYGMTTGGGTSGGGLVFKIMPNGTGFDTVLNFRGANGSGPVGSLISDGTFLYGMTQNGGADSVGTVFKILPNGTGYVKLLDFTGTTNGKNPYGSLIYDGTFLYGMTSAGGANGLGTIFKIEPNGTNYIKLLDFAGTTNGSLPFGDLFYDGTFLFGMTFSGGMNNDGTLFKIKPDGTGYVKLLDFSGAINGKWPYGSLIYDGTFLYGMTETGGTNNLGCVFKIMSNGSGYLKLLDFTGIANGSRPRGSLFYDGTFLYGMTRDGGANNNGIIFKIMPNGGGYVDLFDFAGTSNGSQPYGSLISDGTCLYGMTSQISIGSSGTVFKLAGAVGIKQVTSNYEQIKIYPNPTSDQFYIEANATDNLNVDLYDVNGRHVFSTSVSDKENINVAALENGIYTLTIKSIDRVTNKKLVIVR